MTEKSDKPSIKYWSEADRPREKLLLKGKASLSDAELIAILMGSGNNEESAVDLAKRILNDVSNNLIELSRLTVNDLSKYKGIGNAKAVSIVAAMELGRRRRGAKALEKKTVTSSRDAYEVFQMYLDDDVYEKFMILLLSKAHKVIRVALVGDGGLDHAVVDIRKVYKMALEANASALILGHNHPSGSLKPSNPDISMTKKIKDAGGLLNINVLDHIIVGRNDYYSFADNAML